MAISIATNSSALDAAAAAASVSASLETSVERLSTVKRINAATDDAAGVAIASRLTAEINGTKQAIRNALDGQALIDTAEGVHEEVENILQRMREIAIQNANDTNNSDDRLNLSKEMDALINDVELSEVELEAYVRVSGALDDLGNLLKSELHNSENYKVATTSGYHNKSGVRGSIPKDLWFSVSLAANAKSLASMPQLLMIVSERGIEFGYGASVSPKDFSNGDIKKLVRAAAPKIFDHLPRPTSPETNGIQSSIEADGAWFYRKKHRLTPKQQEFPDLNTWLEYLQSDIGK